MQVLGGTLNTASEADSVALGRRARAVSAGAIVFGFNPVRRPSVREELTVSEWWRVSERPSAVRAFKASTRTIERLSD